MVVNGRDKVICVNKLEANEVQKKVSRKSHSAWGTLLTKQVDLLLTSSGAKIKPLKNSTLEAGPGAESARGLWSAIHDQAKAGGGYRI